MILRGGTVIIDTLIGGVGLGASQLGGVLAGTFEIYLKPNTRYTLKVLSIGACKVSISADLVYEQI